MTEDECGADRKWEKGPDFLRGYEQIKMARDLQKQHDAKKALESKNEAEFQATKAHIANIAALEADRKRKLDESKFSPQSRSSTSPKSRISEYQLDDKDTVVADTRELKPKPREVVAEKYEASYDEPDLIKRKASEAGNAVHNESELIEQKASEAGATAHDESKLIEQVSEVDEATQDESNIVGQTASKVCEATQNEPNVIGQQVLEVADATQDGPNIIEQNAPKVCEATQDEPNIVVQKASEASGQSVVRQIQQYQLLAPRQP